MDVDSTSKSGASSMVPLGIGLLGVVIGVAALFVALNGASKAQLSTLTDTVTAAAAKADAAKSDAESVVSKVADTATRLDGLHGAVQDALNKLQEDINQNKTDIAALKSSGTHAGTAGGTGTGRSGGTATEVSNVGPNGGTYIIKPGDYLSTVARTYGLTLKEIEDANPGVDSNHLKIGQKITIPPPHSSGTSTRGGASTRGATPPPTTASGAPGPATAVAP